MDDRDDIADSQFVLTPDGADEVCEVFFNATRTKLATVAVNALGEQVRVVGRMDFQSRCVQTRALSTQCIGCVLRFSVSVHRFLT